MNRSSKKAHSAQELMKIVLYTAAVNLHACVPLGISLSSDTGPSHIRVPVPNLRCECDREHTADINPSPGAPLRGKSTHL